MFGHYEIEEVPGWNVENAFEGVQMDVEPMASSKDVA